ncbi:hypothetical protein MSIMFB_04242 [Mycobacterium simulans]|uniref:Uncharacterized protein n=1 Tax=Mycobacterium simulans TaxID=627089 RepID=A0A7Z7NC80_9MYCO|nr:hypothetical protein [Mycobacterium simulans]SOJ56766.1 hypothetical protein MSIMFB_04242 [Mycobacterium simulans]
MPTFNLALASEGFCCGCLDKGRSLSTQLLPNGDRMGVIAYIALTVAVFALLGLTQKLVERL